METLIFFVFALMLMAIPIHLHLKKLRDQAAKAPTNSGKSATVTGMKTALPSIPCAQCSTPIPKGTIFCPKCGTPLAMYDLKRAPIVDPNAPEDESAPLKPAIDISSCIGCGTCVSVCPENALALVNHKAVLPDADLCTSAGKCGTVCPTGALVLVRVGSGRKIQVPFVKENYETNVEGLYIVGELGGMALIKHAVNEGRNVVERIRSNLRPREGIADIIVVGAGPAGLSAALSAKKYNFNTITIEAEELASTIRKYPRNKFVMAEPIDIPLYGNLWVQDSSKEGLLTVWQTIVANTGIEVREHTRCEGVMKQSDGTFAVKTNHGNLISQRVILAIGRRGTPRKLDVPGEDLAKVTYQLYDANDYTNCDVLIVGGGDSAVEAAVGLANQKSNRVSISYRRNKFDRIMPRNREAIDRAISEKRIISYFESNVIRINEKDVVLKLKDGSEKSVPNDYSFLLLGGESPNDFLTQMGVEIVTRMIPVS